MAEQTLNHWMSALPIVLQITLLPSEASGSFPHSLAQNVLSTSFYLFVSEHLIYVRSLTLSCIWDAHIYISNYIWLFCLISLMSI